MGGLRDEMAQPARGRVPGGAEEVIDGSVARNQLGRVQIPSLVEAVDSASGARCRSAAARHDGRRRRSRAACSPVSGSAPGRWTGDRERGGHAVREVHSALRERDLHHVTREVTRGMAQVLPRRGDATERGVVVGAEVRAGDASVAGARRMRAAATSLRVDDRLRRLDHDLETERALGQVQPPFERFAAGGDGGDLRGIDDLRNGHPEARDEPAVERPCERRDEQVERAQAAPMQFRRDRLDAYPDERRERSRGGRPRPLPSRRSRCARLLRRRDGGRIRPRNRSDSPRPARASACRRCGRAVADGSDRGRRQSPARRPAPPASGAYWSSDFSARAPILRAESARNSCAPP